MNTNVPPYYLVIGRLTRMFLLPPNKRPRLDVPGGNLLYTAAGLGVWDKNKVGLVARIGEDYPRVWLDEFQKHDFDTRGIHILPQTIDLREFLAYTDLNTRYRDNPITYFAQRELTFPKSLFGYRNPRNKLDSLRERDVTSLRVSDLPPDYQYARAAHFCPLEFLTHNLMPAVLRQAGFTTITLDPSSGYMDPVFWERIPAIITGLTAFLCSEEKLRALFRGRSDDIWEMIEALAEYGCEFIVIKRGIQGQLLYDVPAKTRWVIPAYPSRDVDPTGAGDSFCGGFLAGYRQTHSPLEAVLYGNISSSLTLEGSGPFYALETLPGLAKARLEMIRESARKI